MKAHASKLEAGFNNPQVIADCVAGNFVLLKNVRLLKVSTEDPGGIPGDFAYSKIGSVDGEFVKYAPLNTEAYWLSIQRRQDNPGPGTVKLKIEEVKVTLRLPAYAAKFFRSDTDDCQNKVIKGLSKTFHSVDQETSQQILVWEGVQAMFEGDERIIDTDTYDVDTFTDMMNEKVGFGKHADLLWKDLPHDYLLKTINSFTDVNKYIARREIERREKLASIEGSEPGPETTELPKQNVKVFGKPEALK